MINIIAQCYNETVEAGLIWGKNSRFYIWKMANAISNGSVDVIRQYQHRTPYCAWGE